MAGDEVAVVRRAGRSRSPGHCGKSLLISDAVAWLLDPICRTEITRVGAADRGWGRLLDHLAAAEGRLRRIDGHVTGNMCCGITGGGADDPGRG
jgi:hypothetical protein